MFYPLLLLSACLRAPEPDPHAATDDAPSGDRPTTPAVRYISAPTPEEAFGAAVAFGSDGVLYVGAPHGERGRVYALPGETLEPELILQSSAADRLGAAIAAAPDGQIAIGAPLADEIRDRNGQRLQAGSIAVVWAGAWVSADPAGWSSATTRQDTPDRPTALAAAEINGQWTVAVGMALGETALQLGETRLRRETDHDLAGFALTAGDFDGDGQPEWAVGAPGIEQVHLYDGVTNTRIGQVRAPTPGHFGAAVAAADLDGDGRDELIVGAPRAGEALQGAVSIFSGDRRRPWLQWTGQRDGEMLGFSVAARGTRVAAGGPGSGGSISLIDVANPAETE